MEYLIAPDGGQIAAHLVDTETWPCTWLMEVPHYRTHPPMFTEDGELACGYCEESASAVIECKAVSYTTADGWACEAGHEHVTAEARYEQGWDYAADLGEARGLAKAGTMPVDMEGRPWI
jgi:hypothetical protein